MPQSYVPVTPLVKIADRIYAKLEINNPTGSIKDRMAVYLLDKAEEEGLIHPGGIIVEATSGNTGIAFSKLAQDRGYKMVVVMPSNMTEQRKHMIRSFGAEIVEVGPGDFEGAVVKRDALVEEMNAFCPRQFSNSYNTEAHYKTTGQEILSQVDELDDQNIAAFVAGTGTGGTLMGAGKALKERYADLQIVAVEPAESAVMSGGKPGSHIIQGIGDGFIPPIVDMNHVDEVGVVPEKEAIARAKKLNQELGYEVGISAGANVWAAEDYIKKHQPEGLVITVLCDHADRYVDILS